MRKGAFGQFWNGMNTQSVMPKMPCSFIEKTDRRVSQNLSQIIFRCHGKQPSDVFHDTYRHHLGEQERQVLEGVLG